MNLDLTTEQVELLKKAKKIKWCVKCHEEPAHWPGDYCIGCQLELQYKDKYDNNSQNN